MTAEVIAVISVVAVISAWLTVWRRVAGLIRVLASGWLAQLAGAVAGVVAGFGMLCLLGGLLIPGEGSGVVAVLGLLILAPFSLLFLSLPRRAAPTEWPVPGSEDERGDGEAPDASEDDGGEEQPESMALGAGSEFVAIRFDYANEDGEISRRHVLLRSNGRSGHRLYIQGVDLNRQALRTFRLDRIIGAMTRESDGQVLSAEEVFASLGTAKTECLRPPVVRAARLGKTWETAVFFAGFGPSKRAELESLAEAAGWQVRSQISGTVDYVVAGAMAGRAQLAIAEQNGAAVIDEGRFLTLV